MKVSLEPQEEFHVTHNAHALPGCKQRGNANEETNCRNHSPCTGGRADSEQNNAHKATNDTANAKLFSEELTRWIAITDGPTNEVWMRLLTKRGFDSGEDVAERRRMGSIGECLQRGRAFSRRKIQFTRTTLSDIDGDDSGDFFSERLNCN